jgi:hypothetical protein
MNQIIIDAELKARLNNLNELMEVRDESGRTLGYFHPAPSSVDSEKRVGRSPITREELERRRAEPSGRPLAEILDELSRS